MDQIWEVKDISESTLAVEGTRLIQLEDVENDSRELHVKRWSQAATENSAICHKEGQVLKTLYS